jgi:hypothetical protein
MGRDFFAFLKLVNLVLCVLLIAAWVLFSHLGFNAFDDVHSHYDPDVALLYQIGLIMLFIVVIPLIVTIMYKEQHNKLLFFSLTLLNIFLLFMIVVVFTVSIGY